VQSVAIGTLARVRTSSRPRAVAVAAALPRAEVVASQPRPAAAVDSRLEAAVAAG